MRLSLLALLFLPVVAFSEEWEEAHIWNFINVYYKETPNMALVRVSKVETEDTGIPNLSVIRYHSKILKSIKGSFEVGAEIQFTTSYEGIPDPEELKKKENSEYYIFTESPESIVVLETGQLWPYKTYLEKALKELKESENQAVDTTAANARLFDDDTSKSTNPDVVTMTEAAVVSP